MNWFGLGDVVAEVVAAHIAGADRLQDLQLLRRDHPRGLEEHLVERLRSAQDPAHARLADLAVRLQFTAQWERRFMSRWAWRRRQAVARLALVNREIGRDLMIAALADADDSVKLEAAHALIRWGGPSDIEEVFRTATRQSPSVCASMAEALRRYAPTLAAEALPAVLSSGEPQQRIAALQMFSKWGRSPACQL